MRGISKTLVILIVITTMPAAWAIDSQTVLPDYLRVDLKRLEETWNVLDQVAARVWPGWTGYLDVPFLIDYPNGVRMLVGHPNPPDGFELLAGVEIRGRKVFLDRRQEVAIDLKPPLLGGGGPVRIGKGGGIETVHLTMAASRSSAPGDMPAAKETDVPEEYRTATENQILLNIHELFHCYQRTLYRYRFGNLRYNTDTNYAVYADVEGQALERAYDSPNAKEARELLLDFLAARHCKRRSMNEREQNQESEEELTEGTATYAEAMALQLLKTGYRPKLTQADDPHFLSFAHVEFLLEEKRQMLQGVREQSMEARSRAYPTGCFQALLLTRLNPGWQEGFFQAKGFLDRLIQKKLAIYQQDIAKRAEVLGQRYPVAELEKKHGPIISKRDNALRMILARKGRSYIVNFKPTGEYLHPEARGETFTVGLIQIFPEGLKEIAVADVLLTGKASPIIQDQLYYVKWIDAENANAGDYSLKYGRKEGDDIYYDAEIQTGGFALRAPKARVVETPSRVKITVLSKVKSSQ